MADFLKTRSHIVWIWKDALRLGTHGAMSRYQQGPKESDDLTGRGRTPTDVHVRPVSPAVSLMILRDRAACRDNVAPDRRNAHIGHTHVTIRPICHYEWLHDDIIWPIILPCVPALLHQIALKKKRKTGKPRCVTER